MDLLVLVVAGVITASVIVTLSGILNLELNDENMSGGNLCISKGYKWDEEYGYCGASISMCKKLGGHFVCSEKNNPFKSGPPYVGRLELKPGVEIPDSPFPYVFEDKCISVCKILHGDD